MKIYAENEDGARFEIKDLANMGNGNVLVLKSDAIYTPYDRTRIETDIAGRIGKPVVIIDGRLNVVGMV